MSRKKRKRNKAEMVQVQESDRQQWSNSSIGLARLFEFLGSCQSFPVSIKTAACVSGIPEGEVQRILKESLYYFVWQGEITAYRTA